MSLRKEDDDGDGEARDSVEGSTDMMMEKDGGCMGDTMTPIA